MACAGAGSAGGSSCRLPVLGTEALLRARAAGAAVPEAALEAALTQLAEMLENTSADTPEEWAAQAARLHARPMDLSKPLWEFTIVEGLDNIEGLPPGCFALVAKVHHAAIDGMSGVELATAIRDDPQVREARSALLAMLESLIDAAQAEGTLRRDVAPGDVIQLLALLKRRPVVPDDVAGRVRERTRALLLEALRADGRGALPGEPVRVEEFFDRA